MDFAHGSNIHIAYVNDKNIDENAIMVMVLSL
jgi:hypothetical protein